MSSYWEKVALGEICSFRRGVSYDGQTLKDAPDEGIPYINMKSFTKDGGYSPRGLKFFSGFYTTQDLLTKDDLVIANTDVTLAGDIIGAPAVPPKNLLEGPAVCSHHVTRLRPTANISNTFLCHLLEHSQYRSVMRQHARGTTVQMLDPAAIKKIEISFPSDKLEQARITEILDTLGTQIHQTEALIAKLERIKQGLLTDLLTRGIDQKGQLRPTPDQAPHLYKDSVLGRIPGEWEISLVGREFEIQLGKMLDSEKNVGEFKPYLGNKSVQWERIDLSEVAQLRLTKSDQERFRLKPGDLLVCEGGEVGRAAIWEGQLEECYYQKALHRLRPTGLFRSELMLQFLRFWSQGDVLANHSSQTSIAHLTKEKLATISLPRPPTTEQKKMADITLSHRRRVSSEESKLAALIKLRDGLSDDLLTGRVRVIPLLVRSAPGQSLDGGC